jgi:hypothetical protein
MEVKKPVKQRLAVTSFLFTCLLNFQASQLNSLRVLICDRISCRLCTEQWIAP